MKNSASKLSSDESEGEHSSSDTGYSRDCHYSADNEQLDPATIASDVLLGENNNAASGRKQSLNSVETELDIGSILFDVPELDISTDSVCTEAAFNSFLQALLPSGAECSKTQLLSVLDDIAQLVDGKREMVKRKVAPLPQPGVGSYQTYPLASDIQPLDWLERHWGKWLKYYNSALDRDYLFLDQLGKLDPGLKKALYAKRRSILSETGCQISEIIPKKSVRIEYELEMADKSQLKNAMRLYGSPRARDQRKSSITS